MIARHDPRKIVLMAPTARQLWSSPFARLCPQTSAFITLVHVSLKFFAIFGFLLFRGGHLGDTDMGSMWR